MRREVPSVAAFVAEDEKVTAIVDILLKVFDFARCEDIFGGSQDKKMSLFDFFEVDGVLVESNLS